MAGLYAIAHHHEVAEDCAQDACCVRSPASTANRGPSSRGWVSRIAVNQTLNHLRRDRRLTDLEDRVGDDEMPAPDAARWSGRWRPSGTSGVRCSCCATGWATPRPKIASIVGLPVGTVHSRPARALGQLQRRPGGWGIPDALETRLTRVGGRLPEPPRDATAHARAAALAPLPAPPRRRSWARPLRITGALAGPEPWRR